MAITCIIIPCYNESNRLDVNSFIKLFERNPDIHIWFVNDGSTDNTSTVIKKLSDVPFADLEGYDLVTKQIAVTKQIVIGPDDGSQEIVMRYFSIGAGVTGPSHTHDFPHLVKIEAGRGAVTDPAGNEHEVQTGDYIYIDSNEVHQFRNTGSGPFDFTCVVPQRGEREEDFICVVPQRGEG